MAAGRRTAPSGRERANIEQEWIREYFVTDVEEYEIPLDSATVREWLPGAEPRAAEPADPAEPDDLSRLAAMRDELAARTRMVTCNQIATLSLPI